MIAPGPTRLLAIVAFASFAALLLAGAYRRILAPKAGYVRLNLADKGAIYLMFQGDEFRAATSVKGLKAAAPSKLSPDTNMLSGAFSLPFPDDQFPGQIIKGAFNRLEKRDAARCGSAFLEPSANLSDAGDWVLGSLNICRMDDAKMEWMCWVNVRSPLGNDPEHAPSIQLPAFKMLKLTVEPAPSEGTLGIGLRVHAANAELLVTKDFGDKSFTAQVRVLNEAGVEVASKTDRMPLLGFG
jgi:hypothetical protein